MGDLDVADPGVDVADPGVDLVDFDFDFAFDFDSGSVVVVVVGFVGVVVVLGLVGFVGFVVSVGLPVRTDAEVSLASWRSSDPSSTSTPPSLEHPPCG